MKISSKVDLSLNVFVVVVEDSEGRTRPYHFNMPADASQRGAQLFECCVGEAIIRHEAWVSGNYRPVGESQVSTSVASTPTTAANTTPPAASPAASKKKPAAAAPTEAPATTPSAGPAKKKPTAAPVVEAPKPVEVQFAKTDYCKKLFAGILTEKLGKGWTKVADYATDAAEIAKLLEDEAVVCSVDGEVTEDFRARVIAELESRYDFG